MTAIAYKFCLQTFRECKSKIQPAYWTIVSRIIPNGRSIFFKTIIYFFSFQSIANVPKRVQFRYHELYQRHSRKYGRPSQIRVYSVYNDGRLVKNIERFNADESTVAPRLCNNRRFRVFERRNEMNFTPWRTPITTFRIPNSIFKDGTTRLTTVYIDT